MAELQNCPNCGKLYVHNIFRDVCENCFRAEEKLYDTVSTYLRKRENRTAHIDTVVEQTGVEKALLFKWVKKGRLNLRHFPNLGYPCERCSRVIKEGKVCDECQTSIKTELETIEKINEVKKANHSAERTYKTINTRR
ncbi:membrane protein [Bacillus coahuilensis p1.1.43]|uniref:Membrane protein n=1 Tax=Bacillus coahuilensis p1.1.43 TaxID=1150625 RepID=A0A147K4S3_9BACI|nr:TIGR03826 family flagellar region protein [Bacillus coahuilensis]KUP04470.1 membrane protein [Bacillus coahuilensis p1.1.43]